VARVVVIGASGHGKVVIDALERAGEHAVVGLIDARKPAGTPWYGHTVLGDESALGRLVDELALEGVVIAVGDNAVRAGVADRLGAELPDLPFVNAVHPAARVAAGASLGVGVVVAAGAVLGPDSTVSDHALIYTAASLDHDGTLERCASLAPGVVTGGDVRIGAHSAISIGATVLHGRSVGPHTVVGAGSVVVDDLPGHVVAYGTPARVIRPRREGEPYL
jgi:sugar O-acyltransferase (sialic acid O-acetyltransferase NeuD family)